MKPKLLLPFLFIMLGVSSLSAKVIRVNNQEPTNASQSTFRTLAEGYNNAVNGDTLYIEPSPTPHTGNLTVTKRIVFLGGGFFHAENEGLSSNTNRSTLNLRLNFAEGSSGSKIISISFTVNASGIDLRTNNIEIISCSFFGSGNTFYDRDYPIDVKVSNIENVTISGCYFSKNDNQNGYIFTTRNSPVKNLVFVNNISERRLFLVNNTTGIIANNFIRGDNFHVGGNSTIQIHNNIFLGTTTVTLPSPIGSNLSHNISNSDLFGTTNNNQANISETDIFQGGESPDAKYLIKENGPADDKGRDGVDIGPFGGPKPYKLSGLPDIPTIYDFSTSGLANPDGKLPVTIKVKAN